MNWDNLIGVQVPIKTKDYNENNANGDKREERINEGSGEDKTKDNSKIRFNEKDVLEFKSTINHLYKEDTDVYSDIVKDYGKEFKVPSLYFDMGNSREVSFNIDEGLYSKILAFYDRKTNEVVIKPELLTYYLNNHKDSDILEHALAHELGHAAANQLGLNKNIEGNKEEYTYEIVTVTNELLANLFAAELRVKKKGMPLSNEAVAKQMVKDELNPSTLSNDIDAAEIYLKYRSNYSNNNLADIKEFNNKVYNKILDTTQKKGIIGEKGIEKINDGYFDLMRLELRTYFLNALANRSILVYSAPVLGAAKALLSEKMPFKQFIDKVSDNVSSIKEIKRYLDGSLASVRLGVLYKIEPGKDEQEGLIELEARTLFEKKLEEGGFKNYPEAFLKMTKYLEGEFDELNYYFNIGIESEKKLLRDLSILDNSLGIKRSE